MNTMMCSLALTLLLLSHGVQAEKSEERVDPFHPLGAEHCLPSTPVPQRQLKGVIGAGDRWVGWLAGSETGWLRLKSGETIPPGDWRVSQVDKSGAKLIPVRRDDGCDGVPDTLLSLVSPFVSRPAD